METRWNGWGDSTTYYALPEAALIYLKQFLGHLSTWPDASLDKVYTQVPSSRLTKFSQIDTSVETRVRHARGQSLPDWLSLRSGMISTFPDGVAFPQHPEEITNLLKLAITQNWKVIPYGGGTSVVGHINPPTSETPVLTISMAKLNRLLNIDLESHLAVFEAGVRGPKLEDQLASYGFTLGHYPQSFEYSTLGGWIATRSSGQQSFYYGRIEDIFAGGSVITPLGTLQMHPVPASAAGPDIRQLVLGSEGRLGIITQAIVRIRPMPEAEGFFGVFFPDWSTGINAVREIAQSDLSVSMLRLSNSIETETTLILSGKGKLIDYANQGLRILGYSDSRCLLIFGLTGTRNMVSRTRRDVEAICRQHKGLPTGSYIGKIWSKNRFRTPYLRNSLWDTGIAIDTLETAVPWSQVKSSADSIQASIHKAAEELGEKVLVFAHLSHIYSDGASIYITYLFRRKQNPEETLELWNAMKKLASEEILAHRGTISHQHGVGVDHAKYIPIEKGQVGTRLLSAVLRELDPKKVLNPESLLPVLIE